MVRKIKAGTVPRGKGLGLGSRKVQEFPFGFDHQLVLDDTLDGNKKLWNRLDGLDHAFRQRFGRLGKELGQLLQNDEGVRVGSPGKGMGERKGEKRGVLLLTFQTKGDVVQKPDGIRASKMSVQAILHDLVDFGVPRRKEKVRLQEGKVQKRQQSLEEAFQT